MEITAICNGKATVIRNGGEQILVSYSTEVCRYDGSTFVRIGRGIRTDSQTTMRHINYFRGLIGLPKITKSQWNKM